MRFIKSVLWLHTRKTIKLCLLEREHSGCVKVSIGHMTYYQITQSDPSPNSQTLLLQISKPFRLLLAQIQLFDRKANASKFLYYFNRRNGNIRIGVQRKKVMNKVLTCSNDWYGGIPVIQLGTFQTFLYMMKKKNLSN